MHESVCGKNHFSSPSPSLNLEQLRVLYPVDYGIRARQVPFMLNGLRHRETLEPEIHRREHVRNRLVRGKRANASGLAL
jgi:hypothetical protein